MATAAPEPVRLVPAVRDSVTAFVALGANLGDAQAMLARSIADIGAMAGVQLLRRSSLYRTAPVDSSGPDYINAVVALATTRTAPDLMTGLLELEQAALRERPYRNAPRTLDLDLLLYGSARIDSAMLQLPHPRMWQRAFVLVPLAQIAPELVSEWQLQQVADQACQRIG
jgi:2-amino-4-hydroxy-6-hydroxymethyldihydropteridine diphosphokinase